MMSSKIHAEFIDCLLHGIVDVQIDQIPFELWADQKFSGKIANRL